MGKPNLERINILLVDNDAHTARIVVASLRELGFTSIQHVRNSNDAINYIETQPMDILITEWLIEPMNGIELVQQLRLGKHSRHRGIPIIMLTGKGELIDVTTARDAGITEFLVKPFTVQNLYDRLGHLVDHPRSIVLSEKFVGPDRRRRAPAAAENSERRKMKPKEISGTVKNVSNEITLPVILQPDHEIKRTIGMITPLSSLITPDMLRAAESFLDTTHSENLQSVKEDLDQLAQAFFEIKLSPGNVEALEKMQAYSLAIKARSGTFGFVVPSQIARILYLFLLSNYDSAQRIHNNVLQQCIEAMKVIFAHDPKGQTGLANQLVQELEQLIARITKP